MRIAFDLDGTLVPVAGGTEAVRPALLRFLFRERLRPGAVALLRALAGARHELWIYTTSLRPVWYVHWWFRLLGVRLAGVVNHDRHRRALHASPLAAQSLSKFPPAFGIDLLVDDAPGVRLEGERHGFSVLLVDRDAASWTAAVMARVAESTRALRASTPRR